jgi:hypothetical protein
VKQMPGVGAEIGVAMGAPVRVLGLGSPVCVCDALVERARTRARDIPEDAIAALIGEALRAVRAQSRS